MKNSTLKIIFILPSFLFIFFLPAKTFAATDTGVFNFIYKTQTFTVDSSTLSAWQGPQTLSPNKIFAPNYPGLKPSLLAAVGLSQTASVNTIKNYHFKLSSIYDYLTGLETKINQAAIEPVLKIENLKVTEFTPPQTGLSLNVYRSALDALLSLEMDRTKSELAVLETVPNGSLVQSNDLGINELVAQGVSSFKGSPNNRRHNITVGVEKFKGVILPQGAEFSFNNFLGEVDAANGFLPELVIKKEGTVPEFGGGLCQVSSTTFRAAMAAGLPITQRRNHAYAVQYYAPQGTDATIYPGSVDLKFINDTPGAILVWPYLKDKDTLVFDFYGTKDSRQVTLEKPVQYDRMPDGSMKATWTRIVAKNGIPRTDVFKSNYQSPALFHKTEQFVTTPTSTQATLTPAPKPIQ